MGAFSIWHWLIVLAIVLVLFGGGNKLSRLMGDFGKGLKSFKRNIADDDKTAHITDNGASADKSEDNSQKTGTTRS